MTNAIVPHSETPAHAISPERARACGVGVDQSHFWMDEYTGTAEALIAAGIIAASQVPGQPGAPKYAATYYAGVFRPARAGSRPPKDENYLNIHRPANGKKIRVIVGVTETERKRRQEAASMAWRAEQQASRSAAQDSNQGLVDALAKLLSPPVDDVQTYRREGMRLAWNLWHLASTEHRKDFRSPFSFELGADAATEMNGLVRRIHELFSQSAVVPASAKWAAYAQAKGDGAFQSFMKNQGLRDFDSLSRK